MLSFIKGLICDELPEYAYSLNGQDRIKAMHDGLYLIGVASSWNGNVAKRDYRNAIMYHIDEAPAKSWSFDKDALVKICNYLNIRVDPAKDTTRDMRRWIGNRSNFDYSSPSSYIRDFREEELEKLTFRVMRE